MYPLNDITEHFVQCVCLYVCVCSVYYTDGNIIHHYINASIMMHTYTDGNIITHVSNAA